MKKNSALKLNSVELPIFGGLTLTYTDIGKGETVLFIPGGGSDVEYSEYFLDKLSRYYRVVSFNYPGFSGSSSLKVALTAQCMMELIHSFIHALGLSPKAFVGHSMGAGLALQYAAAYPNDVEKLIVFSPVVEKYPRSLLSLGLSVTKSHLQARKKLPDAYPEFNALFWRDFMRSKHMWEHMNYVKNFEEPDVSKIKALVLGILGSDDIILDAETQKRNLDKIPGTNVIIVDEEGHDTYLLKSDELIPQMVEFIEAV